MEIFISGVTILTLGPSELQTQGKWPEISGFIA
jgi:hypothetical protein